jgi:bifunctional non-homologous end joining protein LigD
MPPATRTPGGLTLERGSSRAPWPIRPMLPTAAPPFHRPGWVYEEKYDGWRLMAHRQGDVVRLLSRTGLDCAGRFRELAAAIASLPASPLILDGEVAVFDDQLLSRLDFLRRPDPQALVTPPIYITFDCVYLGERDLRHCPLGARREVLERLIEDQHLLLAARRLPAHGLDAWEEVQRRGYEGLVAKDEASAYFGGRTRSWLKVKRRHLDGPSGHGATPAADWLASRSTRGLPR